MLYLVSNAKGFSVCGTIRGLKHREIYIYMHIEHNTTHIHIYTHVGKFYVYTHTYILIYIIASYILISQGP